MARSSIKCIEWRLTMAQLVREQKWDLLERNPECGDRHHCIYGCSYNYQPLRPLLQDPQSFTHEMYQLICTMYGELSPVEWTRILMIEFCHPPLLRYLLQHEHLHIDQAEPTTLLAAVAGRTSFDSVRFLLSPEVGAPINLPSIDGSTPLLHYIRSHYTTYESDDFLSIEWQDSFCQGLEFLLEAGADPLLENKEGVSPLSYIEQITTLPLLNERILTLLRRFV